MFAKDTFRELSGHMHFLTERDKVLAGNIANVDTPSYKPKDIKKNDDFSSALEMKTTSPMHIKSNPGVTYQPFESEILELKPNGNAVTVEHEMMKKSVNATELQQTANIYQKARNMLKTSIVGIR
jgi:flagellar basal-body rod protein FlgB